MIALKVHRLCLLFFTTIFFVLSIFAHPPRSVTSGTVKRWKIEQFDHTYGTQLNGFDLNGSSTGHITREEFWGYDTICFGRQYSGTLEVPQTRSYSINMYNIDRIATLYVDGVQRAVYTQPASRGSITDTISLTSGDYGMLLKSIRAGGVSIRWNGSELAANSGLERRFARVDNAQMAACYKALNVNITPNYSDSRLGVNNYINQDMALAYTRSLNNPETGWRPITMLALISTINEKQ